MDHSNKSGYSYNLRKPRKICRGCLFVDYELKHVLNENLRAAFTCITGLQVQNSDNLTTWLCQHCYMLLQRVINFKKTACNSDFFLRKYHTQEMHDNFLTEKSAIIASPIQIIHACDRCNNCDITAKELDTSRNQVLLPKNVYHIVSEDIRTAMVSEILNNSVTIDTCNNDNNDGDGERLDSKDSKQMKAIGKVKKRKALAQVKFKKLQKELKANVNKLKTIRIRSKMKKISDQNIKLVNNEKFENVYANDEIIEEFVALDTLPLSVFSTEAYKKCKNKTNFEHLLSQKNNSQFCVTNPNPIDTMPVVKWEEDSSDIKGMSIVDENLVNINSKLESENYKIKVKNRKKKNKASVLDRSKIEVMILNEDEQISELKKKAEHVDFIKALFKCVMCVKSFPYLESYQLHMKRHDQSAGPLRCVICHQHFSNPAIMRGHILTHSTRFKCRLCCRIFHHKFTARRHLLRHDGFFMCKKCPETYSDKKDYSDHLKTHNTPVTIFSCPMCPKTFKAKCNYNIHIRKHTGELGFPCDRCDSVFASAAARSSHSSVHVTTKHFYCAACDASFKTEPKLQYHLRTSPNHVDASYFGFPCDRCPRRYATQLKLSAHFDAAHSTQARYACQSCPLLYKSANGLRHHKRNVHEGKKPERKHTCDTCGRSFSNNVILTNHIRTHTGEQPFECPTCHRRFSQKAAMQTHIKLVHLKLKRNIGLKSKNSHLPETEKKLVQNFKSAELTTLESNVL